VATLEAKPLATILITQPWITVQVALGLREALDGAGVQRKVVEKAETPVSFNVEKLLPYGDVVTGEELDDTRATLKEAGATLAHNFVAEGCSEFVKLPGPPDYQGWLQVHSEEQQVSVLSVPLEQPYRWLFEIRAGR
jgi:hypothetical protein